VGTSTNTTSNTFTIANARQVASKIKTDLKLVQREYDYPSDTAIENYGDEAAELLNRGYLGTVSYGFRRDGNWVFVLTYTARTDGTLTADDRAGKVPRGLDLAGTSFYSYLTYSPSWDQLTGSARDAVNAALPFQRTGAPEPGTAGGYWTSGQTYASNGSGTERRTYVPT
jgi:hypothetical protein